MSADVERVLAIRHDAAGRLCAFGVARTIDDAEAEAERQWQIYAGKHPEARRGALSLHVGTARYLAKLVYEATGGYVS